MVQISVDTDKDSPQTIAKVIEMLHSHLRSHSIISNNNQSSFSTPVPVQNPVQPSIPSPSPVDSNPFNMFDSSSIPSQNISDSSSLPSSAPVSNPSSVFSIFGDEPKSTPLPSSSQVASSSDPFSMFDEPKSKPTSPNIVAGFADDDLFNTFSNDFPSTTPSQVSSSTPDLGGLNSSFESAQSLLDDNFNPIIDESISVEEKSEEKQSNFFNFEKY